MTVVEYYRRAVWTPLLVPLLATPSLLISYGLDWWPALNLESEAFGKEQIAVFLLVSLIAGGIPYLFMMWLHRRLIREGTEAQWYATAWCAPFKILPWLAIWLWVLLVIYAKMQGVDSPSFDVFLAIYFLWCLVCGIVTLLLGYTYVLIILGQLWLLKKVGWIR